MEKLKNKRLWVMVGVPGSGKSTFIANHKDFFNEQKAIISRDEIRFSFMKEGDSYFTNETKVFNEFIKQIINSLNTNIDTIVDATHISKGSRRKLLKALGTNLKDIEVNAIVISVPLDVAIERNNKREGIKIVPEIAIMKMYNNYEEPIIEEGFDNIWIRNEVLGEEKPTYKIIKRS